MSCGLRPIHSVAMITCVSERSGSASSCDRVALTTPHTVSKIVAPKTKMRRRAESSMIRAISPSRLGSVSGMPATRCARCTEPTLGGEQELSAGGHALARNDARFNPAVVTDSTHELHLTRLGVRPMHDEHDRT